MTVAERLNDFIQRYDPYAYEDNEGSVEKTEKALMNTPLDVVSELLDILEDMEERGQI